MYYVCYISIVLLLLLVVVVVVVVAVLLFCNAGPVLFGCAPYVPPLMKYVESYGIKLDFGDNLVKVDGPNQTATFKVTEDGAESQMIERKFDMLHVCPPQYAPDFIKNSPLANEAGWMAVNQETLQSTVAPNIFGLGDVTSTPNAKTVYIYTRSLPGGGRRIPASLLRPGRLIPDNSMFTYKFPSLLTILYTAVSTGYPYIYRVSVIYRCIY